MRALLRRSTVARAAVTRFIDENAWLPLAGKALGILLSMLVLAGIGSGWLDTTLDLGPPRAEAASVARAPARARAASPAVTATATARTALTPPAAAPPAHAPATAPRVVLNTASEAELQRLPGVGPTKARAILALREKLGRFRRFEDLLRVRGIKRRTLERIRERAVLDPPPPESGAPPPGPSASASPAAPPW